MAGFMASDLWPGYFDELDLDVFKKQMDVNYFGTLNCIKVLLTKTGNWG